MAPGRSCSQYCAAQKLLCSRAYVPAGEEDCTKSESIKCLEPVPRGKTHLICDCEQRRESRGRFRSACAGLESVRAGGMCNLPWCGTVLLLSTLSISASSMRGCAPPPVVTWEVLHAPHHASAPLQIVAQCSGYTEEKFCDVLVKKDVAFTCSGYCQAAKRTCLKAGPEHCCCRAR